MINRKLLITTVLSVVLFAGNAVFADSDLLRMDVKKASSEDTVDVTFYTTGAPTNTVVTRKSGNTYVVLLPNVAGNQSIVPALGGVKDLVSNVNVKNVDDGIGGYTKVTFNTVKPVKIQTYTKKTAPLTKAQQDYKNLIAKNSKFDPDKKFEDFKKSGTSTTSTVKTVSPVIPKTNVAKTETTKPVTSKPVETKNEIKTAQPKIAQTKTTQTKSTQNTNKISLRPITVNVPDMKAGAVKTETVKAEAVKAGSAKAKAAKTETVKTETTKAKTVKAEAVKAEAVKAGNAKAKVVKPKTAKSAQNIQPKAEKKSVMELKQETKPKATNKVKSAEVAPAPSFDLKNPPAASKNANANNLKTKEPQGLPIIPIAGVLSVIGILTFGAFMNIILKAIKNNFKLKEYLENYTSEPQKPKNTDYSQILDNDNLSWQEKYKLYSQSKDSQNQEDSSYVANLDGTKGVLVNDDMAARVSQMEHALSQTPSMNQFEPTLKGVQSEDDAITRQMSGLNLKSFAKNLDLKMTSRQNLSVQNSSMTEPMKESQHITLKNTELNISQRNFGGHSFSISDLVRKGRRFLPKPQITNEMEEIQEQYLVSSLEEYLNILDNENQIQTPVKSSDTVEEITNMLYKRNRSGMKNATNPMAEREMLKNSLATDFNISIKSRYDIDNNKSIYMVESDGITALVGKVGENVYVLKKFDKIVNKPLQVRLDYGNVYIVRVGGFKCLVDVAEDKMGTLLEI